MSTRDFKVVRGKRLRITELDETNSPSGQMVVTRGFVTVGMEPEIEDGDEYIQKDADGGLCVNDRTEDALKRFNLTLELCGVMPDLLSIITRVNLEEDGDDVVGYRAVEGNATRKFALELWTGIPANDQITEEFEYGYLLLPHVTGGIIGEVEVGNETTTFPIDGAYTLGGAGWGTGPYDVIDEPASPLQVPIAPDEHHLFRTTQVPPPEVTDGAVEIPTGT